MLRAGLPTLSGLIDARFAAYVLVSAVLICTPGPDTMLVTRNALCSGRRAARFTSFGIATGITAWMAASMLGVYVLIRNAEVAFTVLKAAGALYLAYLGVRSIVRSVRGGPPPTDTSAPVAGGVETATAFGQGLLSNLLNVKTGAFVVTVVPQFVNTGDSLLRLVLMVVVFELMVLAWLNGVGYVASRAGRSSVSARAWRAMNGLAGAVLIGLGVRLAFQSR
jgi:threonine/homoserine/homoserine lactone efflux protein